MDIKIITFNHYIFNNYKNLKNKQNNLLYFYSPVSSFIFLTNSITCLL